MNVFVDMSGDISAEDVDAVKNVADGITKDTGKIIFGVKTDELVKKTGDTTMTFDERFELVNKHDVVILPQFVTDLKTIINEYDIKCLLYLSTIDSSFTINKKFVEEK